MTLHGYCLKPHIEIFDRNKYNNSSSKTRFQTSKKNIKMVKTYFWAFMIILISTCKNEIALGIVA